MLGGVFDPFARLTGNSENTDTFPSIHVGVVKSYISATNSVMILVPTINTGSAIGPCKVMKNYGVATGLTTKTPQKGDKAVVALIDGSPNSAIVLGYL